ncbi:cAMP-binding domain of CRP or a regulatory subunit of cAMP-dependent protein kinases [Marivirga sericea]|uniref:cAMP-binding domain of CRP or a regulatory subunit of cAMP-dependent protein kinases n=1 Tax=Marivirga sericea TaxID=1028 RepID=A0A1X7LEL5_9BACT|nr:Crp/Fnr family transcriptional regulator [Marivirga sericea]SMG51954.1 cAMP-binding domain of CRP or a regulatory subunit of cAMP-dependent protein kinases [Marivirga sericea]
MTELEQNIKSYFGVFQKEDLKTVSSLFQLETIKKGDYFLKTGNQCNKLSFIKSGYLRIYKTTEDKEVTQWISTPSYFVTDLSSLLFNEPARWTIQALTDTVLYTINRTDYEKIGSLVPQWHELEKLFIGKCFAILEDRIFSHLSMTAEERYEHFFENNKELFNQVPLQYIASMLGMTPETFSRVRKKQLL